MHMLLLTEIFHFEFDQAEGMGRGNKMFDIQYNATKHNAIHGFLLLVPSKNVTPYNKCVVEYVAM